MSERRLALTALALAGVIVLLGLFAAQRLGYLASPPTPQWEFKNHLLDCRLGSRAIIRPGLMGQESRRYWFLRSFREPSLDDPDSTHEVSRYAHVRAAVEVSRPPDERWYLEPPGVAYFSYRQLGALTHTEFLEEIDLVEEDDGAGGTRTMLRARFGTPSKADVWYVYDPADPAPQTGFGWERVENHATSVTSEVYYLQPAPFREPPLVGGDGK